jgi:hypothetical protein
MQAEALLRQVGGLVPHLARPLDPIAEIDMGQAEAARLLDMRVFDATCRPPLRISLTRRRYQGDGGESLHFDLVGHDVHCDVPILPSRLHQYVKLERTFRSPRVAAQLSQEFDFD